VVLSKFNEDVPKQHMMKILFGCGIYAAFRGSSEHVNFSPSHVSFGIYPMSYEVPELRGVRYVSIDAFGQDKSHKITVNSNYSRETSATLSFPINENDPNCFGASLRRYIAKLSPGQKRMYCYWSTDDSAIYDRSDGKILKNIFHARKPLGMNKIRELFTEGAAILGLPSNFLPHSLRALCITRLVNDSAVSLSETMEVARHSSVAASKDYMVVDGVSAFNRMKALGAFTPAQECRPPPSVTNDSDRPTQLSTVTPSFATDGSQKNLAFKSWSTEKDDENIAVGAYRGKNTNVSMTQQGIEDLKEEIADFQSSIAQQTASPPIMSNNQREIAELRQIVKTLKGELENYMQDRLYFDSVTNDYENDIAILNEENEILRARCDSPTGREKYRNSRSAQQFERRNGFGRFKNSDSNNDVMDPGEYTRARQRALALRLNEQKRKRDRDRKGIARRRLF
jgi:hypothetical protein